MESEDQHEQMYYEMARAVEKAIRILIEAQQRCEEMYISRRPAKMIIDLPKT